MARRTSDACVSCGSCTDECPVGVISQGDTQCVIDESGCADCDACEVVCPVGVVSEANREESQ